MAVRIKAQRTSLIHKLDTMVTGTAIQENIPTFHRKDKDVQIDYIIGHGIKEKKLFYSIRRLRPLSIIFTISFS